jgi:hypothetical protein
MGTQILRRRLILELETQERLRQQPYCAGGPSRRIAPKATATRRRLRALMAVEDG